MITTKGFEFYHSPQMDALSLGEHLTIYRKYQELTQQQVALKAKLTIDQVRRIEQDKDKNIDHVFRYLSVFSGSISILCMSHTYLKQVSAMIHYHRAQGSLSAIGLDPISLDQNSDSQQSLALPQNTQDQ